MHPRHQPLPTQVLFVLLLSTCCLQVERLVHTGCTPAAGVSAASPSQSDADGQAGVSGQGFGRVIIRTRFLRQQEQGAARMQR
jgi:hypothetical protein